jgi:hypothetical protein
MATSLTAAQPLVSAARFDDLAPMPPSTDWKESIPADEAARFERYAEDLRELQRKQAAGGRANRALHAKGHPGIEARFVVLPDLPEHARIGMFAEPHEYRAYVRFSNGASARQPDRKADVRGVAVKVMGVPGKKIIPGLEDEKTQDFLLIQSAATPFRNADEFVGFVKAASRPALALPRLLGLFGPIRAVRVLKKLARGVSTPIASVATTPYFSALPIKFGPYAVHYALAPHAHPSGPTPKQSSADYLGEELAERLRNEAIEYDFRVQFFQDEERTPIEDASVEWKESDAPFTTIARLVIPQQDLQSPHGRRVSELVEGLSFDPWHATEDFRPLGNMMRARNHAYRVSTQERGAAAEPDGNERID